MKSLFIIPPALLLSACSLSNGQCRIPDSEAAIRHNLMLNMLTDDYRANNVIGSPSDYLRANPDCCSVTPLPFSPLKWIMWDRFSLPKYEVETMIAYRVGSTVQTYSSFGKGDSCGRVPGAYGDGERLVGPSLPPRCAFADETTPEGGSPKMCVPDQPPSALPVPIGEANALRRERWEREKGDGERRAD
jgi:hypothetical protein